MNFIERAAAIARCHSDDRPRRDNLDWNDGYQDGCKGASTAIYNDQVLIDSQQEIYDLRTAVNQLYEELRLALECNPCEGWSERANVVIEANKQHVTK